MVDSGKLKAGDKALVWDIFHQEGRSKSSQGCFDALEKTLGKGNVEKLDVTQDIDSDPTKGIPVMTAYLAAHPDLKAIGTQHGQITAILPKILKDAGKKPGDVVVGGIDLARTSSPESRLATLWRALTRFCTSRAGTQYSKSG